MSEHAKGKNHQRGAVPRKQRVKRRGRNRPAKGYDQIRRAWVGVPENGAAA
jgi:hypothetical protein